MHPDIKFIGIIHSPFTELQNMPIQPAGAPDTEGEVEVYGDYAEGLRDLDKFSHIYLIYYFHKAPRTELQVVPFMDTEKRGVFSTRSPLRPSHIGMSIVNLISVDGNRLKIRGIDILDGTPLIDIKPFIPQFDCIQDAKSGWMRHSVDEIKMKRADERFK
jgi:tRNA (adenine37-N6)-methyltransferase